MLESMNRMGGLMRLAVAMLCLIGAWPLLAQPVLPRVQGTERFQYAGQVVDERGAPVEGAEVTATHHAADGKSYGYIELATTDAEGKFSIDTPQARSGARPGSVQDRRVQLDVKHPSFLLERK